MPSIFVISSYFLETPNISGKKKRIQFFQKTRHISGTICMQLLGRLFYIARCKIQFFLDR